MWNYKFPYVSHVIWPSARRRQVSVGLLRERLAVGAQRAGLSWQERIRHAGDAEQAGLQYER